MSNSGTARFGYKSGIDRVLSGHTSAYGCQSGKLRRRRLLKCEHLEARELLTIAHDLAVAVAPYQAPLVSALNAATALPLVGKQLAGLPDFAAVLVDTESSISSQVEHIASDGHYQVTVPLPSLSKTFDFDLGLDAFLKATAAGNVHAEINPALSIAFDVTAGAAVLDVGQTRLDIDFGLSLPGFQGTFSLNGFLFTRAVDAGTNFNGDLGFKFAPGGALVPQLSGQANVLLDVSMSFVDPALSPSFNPTFDATLDMKWGFDANNQLTAPSVSLVNAGLEADSFLHGFLGDVVKTVQKFTKPIQPFIDVFQTPVPIVSAFDSSETIGTLLLKGAGTSSAAQDSFKTMVQIINAVNSIDLSGNAGGAVIPFGTITVTGNPAQAGAFGFDTSQTTSAIDDIFDISALQSVEEALKKVGNYAGPASTAGFQFPLLENPGSAITGILLGQPDVTLFSFSTGRQHFALAPTVGVGIPGILGLFLDAGITFDANLTMGYDTAGLLAYKQNPSNPGKLLHGFYFDNSIDTSIPPSPNGPDIRRTGLYLQGFMQLKADALLAHVSGGLTGNIIVELANTDATNHVHLDTMIGNLTSGGKVFRLGGKLCASADLSLALELPIGPDITLFSFNLAYEELLNFDPAPAPFGLPVRVFDENNQHTLLLDVGKMSAGSVVTVQPFHDLTVSSGSSFEADGIRVDYPGGIDLYVERKNNNNTNYYNLIALDGTAPDRVSINVLDPFRVFADEGAANPSPGQTKPAVLLVGGGSVIYSYSEAPDGSQANALLVGGYGSNTLTGGTMTFGNFIPANRLAQAKSHFADGSGFDALGQGLINSQIDAAIAPANPAGVIGAKMTSSRGGLMMGGPGGNSFIAGGAGDYEMIGGSWVNSFNISPSFSGRPASYQIDGGPYGSSTVIVRVPFDETVLFENAAVPDKYDPEFKALSMVGRHGPSAVAHGIQTVKVVASPGSTIEFGDTSELNVKFSIEGGARLKFSGTAAPDVFDVSVLGPFVAKKDHFTSHGLFTDPAHPTELFPVNPLVPGISSTTPHDPLDPQRFGTAPLYLPTTWPDPVYTIKRTFGTNGRTLSIPFAVSDADASSIVLDGKASGDTYIVEQGVGGFLDITIDDSESATRNSATVRLREPDIVFSGAKLTDNSVKVEFYTVPHYVKNMATLMPDRYPDLFDLDGYLEALNSVYYSPTVLFGGNIDLGLEFSRKFLQFVIDRAMAPQDVEITFGVNDRSMPPGGRGDVIEPFYEFDIVPSGTVPGRFLQIPSWVYDPDGPNPEMIVLGPAPAGTGGFRTLFQQPVIDVLKNSGDLSLDLMLRRDRPTSSVNSVFRTSYLALANIHANSGTMSFHTSGILGTLNFLSNSGTINFDFPELGTEGQVVNVLGTTGTINVAQVEVGKLQLNLGDNGDMTNVHGAMNLAKFTGVNIVLDDRNNPAAGRRWLVETTHLSVGDLTVDFATRLFGFLEIRPNPHSTVVFNDSVATGSGRTVIGAGTGNTLIGPLLSSGQTWHIDGPDSGTMDLDRPALYSVLRWQNMQTLVGSGGNDTFQFAGGSVSGSIDGGGGNNTLSYDDPPTPFDVDLASGTAPLVGDRVSNIQAVIPDTTHQSPAQTGVELASSRPTSVYGQSLTFTAVVSALAAGSPMPTGSVQFQIDGANYGSSVPLSNGTAATAAISNLSAGEHRVSVAYLGSTQFATSQVEHSQTITRAPLLIKADDKTKPYGAATPALTASYQGFVNGDTAARLNTPAVLSTPATAGSLAGRYAISVSGATSDNYTITFAAGTLTVTEPAPRWFRSVRSRRNRSKSAQARGPKL